MKQPELGRKISELRKEKGFTQEELVEKCNISVRTIQRIETGEVMPRSYTIKSILSALDYDLNRIAEESQQVNSEKMSWLRNLMLFDIDQDKPLDIIIKQLNIAWIFGIIYFILGFIEGAAEFARFDDDQPTFGTPGYVFVKVFVLISYIFFQRGFILIGGIFKNYLLKIISLVFIGVNVLIIGFEVVSVFYDTLDREVVMLGASLTYGAIGIIYGISLTRLEQSLGTFAKLAGILEIIAACFFLTVVLFFVGFIIQIPAELFEIILIFKAIEIIKAKQIVVAQ